MVKLSDYVFQVVAGAGVKHVFMLPGGGAMHLVNSLGSNPDLQFIACHHEQAAAIAAEAYGKYTNNLGVALVTTGPGGTNAITGVVGAWQDSTPTLFISGQVKRSDLMTGRGVRVMGMQEADIVTMVQSVTKYAVTVMEPETIRYHLEQALYLARTGRPGPVWIDIPLDVQATMMDPDALEGFTPPSEEADPSLPGKVAQAIALLNEAERPVILVGNGVRLAKAQAEFEQFVRRAGVPVLCTWLAPDLMPWDDNLFIGRPGATAARGHNFALQNSDFLLTIGTRLDLVLTGFSHSNLARAARKVMVDIDGAEIRKMQTPIDVPICGDAGVVLREFIGQQGRIVPKDRASWLARCREWKSKYPVVLPEHRARQGSVSTYMLAEVMSDLLRSDDVIVSGSSGAGIEIYQLAMTMKHGQRLLHTTALGPMGCGLPSSIAASLAGAGRRVIAVDGDGGFQLNIQELETLVRLRPEVKYFVLSNNGYASIRAMQRGRFEGHLVACDPSSGLTLPSLERIAAAYGLPFVRIADQANLREDLERVLGTPGPVICEVMSTPDEARVPSLAARQRADGTMVSSPLEDLSPLLSREELQANMLIPLVEE